MRGLDDSSLSSLISRLPAKSLALMEDIDAAFLRGISRDAEPQGTDRPPGSPPSPPNAAAPAPQGVTLSGLLAAIDGVSAQEGRLLFATTNRYAALDAALTRPGRLDMHVEYALAGRWQAEELFKCFFPASVPEAEGESDTPLIRFDDEKRAGGGKEKLGAVGARADVPERAAPVFSDHRSPCPPLAPSEVARLAKEFGARIPEREFSMAAIQGLLMQYKTRPHLAIEETGQWVEGERKRRRDQQGKEGKPGDVLVPVSGRVEESKAGHSTPPTTDGKAPPSPTSP